MSGVTIELDDAEILSLLRKLSEKCENLHTPLKAIGEGLLLSHEDRWKRQVSPDGQAWQPLSHGYYKSKPKNKNKILVLEGYLKNLHYSKRLID